MKKTVVQKGTFRFANGPLTEDIQGEYYYSDDYFLRNAAILNPHLRTLSFVLCMTCFPSVEAKKESPDYVRVYRYAEEFLTEIGFSDFRVNPDYEKPPSADTLAVLAAHKVIEVHGEKVSLIAVGLRGADYGDEWAANLIMGEKGPAYGFNESMVYARQFLEIYMEELGRKLCRRVKFWITGYSRVAGVANLLGASIDKYAQAYKTDTGDIYVYTFEGPGVASKEDTRPYPSIHNTINPHDLVMRMPPGAWGFRRYGVDDTVFPAINSEGFTKRIDEVKERVRQLNPTMYYDPQSFRVTSLKKLKLVGVADLAEDRGLWRMDEWWYHAKMDEFLDRFMEFMCKKIPHPEDGEDPSDAQRRRRFALTYQEAFSRLAKSFMGKDEETKEGLRQALRAFAKEDITARGKMYLGIRLFQNREYSCRQVESYLRRQLEKRLLSDDSLGVSKDVLQEFFGAIENLTYYFIKCASYDMRRHNLAYMTSLFCNLDQVKAAHMPEVIFAWLMTLDSYYHKDMSGNMVEMGKNPYEYEAE